jgi:hypothetical protein
MPREIITYIRYPVLIVGIVLCLVGVAYAAGNIDSTYKWAWGTNVGWINFAPTHGGVTVYDDHLEGYAWGENIGWIRMGTHTDGSPHTYLNTMKDNYGVNNDGNGNLSGYAWGTNVGWINWQLRRLRLGREHRLDTLQERQPCLQRRHHLARH